MTLLWYGKCMTEESTPKRRGRPATGVTPKRNVRIGAVWTRGEEIAEERGMTMTAFVEEALRREIARSERQQSR
jgi:hypothetical protein